MANLLTLTSILSPLAVLAVLLTALPVSAQEPRGAASPIVEPQTFLLGRIDLNRVDADALGKWFAASMDALPKDVDAAERTDVERDARARAAHVSRVKDALVQAGAPVVYFAIERFPLAEPALYVPMPGAVDNRIDAVAQLLYWGDPTKHDAVPDARKAKPDFTTASRLGQGVFFGRAVTYRRLLGRSDKTGAPALEQALAAAPAAAVQMVVAPSEDLRHALEETLPQLGAPMNVPVNDLASAVRGLRTVTLTLQAPPDASLRFVAQCADAASAKSVAALIERLPQRITEPDKMRLWELNDVGLQFLAGALPPRVEDDRVVVELSGDKLRPITAAALLWLERADQRERAVQSASHIRQILQGVLLYANDHKGQVPERLDQLEKYQVGQAVLTNPRGTGAAKPDYLYRKHPDGVNAPGDAVIVWENPANLPPWPRAINLGFGDGHVEMVLRDDALNAIHAGQFPLPATQPAK